MGRSGPDGAVMSRVHDETEIVRAIIRSAAIKAGLHIRTKREDDGTASAVISINRDILVRQQGHKIHIWNETLSLADPDIEQELAMALYDWACPVLSCEMESYLKKRCIQPLTRRAKP